MQREEKMRKFNFFGFMNMNPSHDVKAMEAHKYTLTATHINIRATFESVRFPSRALLQLIAGPQKLALVLSTLFLIWRCMDTEFLSKA